MNDAKFFSEKSAFTNLGRHVVEFAGLNNITIENIVKIVQGLLIHVADGFLFGIIHPVSRLNEKNLRYVHKILDRAKELDNRSLLVPREPAQRVIVTCRDFAAVCVAICRFFKIPARIRAGFVSYLYHNQFFGDHRLVEYWDSKKSQWILLDCRLAEMHKPILNIDFDLYNLPTDKFVNAGQAWLECLAQPENAQNYCYGLDRKLNGKWYIRDILMQDLACLNKLEMLPWDAWGFMYYSEPRKDPSGANQLATLLDLARLIANNQMCVAELENQFAQPSLKVPSIIISYDKLFGPCSIEL